MSNAAALLRLLEPAVRPDGVNHAPPARAPIEAQRFDELLGQARQNVEAPQGVADAAAADESGRPHGALDALAGLDRMDNAAIRTLRATRAGQ